MENKNLQNFIVFLKEHKDVQEALKKEMNTLGDDKKEVFVKLVEFGRKNGFEFTAEDLKSSENLSDAELVNINGGRVPLTTILCVYVTVITEL